MIKNKIIFIGGTPLSNIQSQKFLINGFLSQNIDVEYWNLSKIYYSSKALAIYFGGHPDYGKNDFSIERKFSSIKDVKKALTEVSSNTIFCYMDGFMQSGFWLLRCFKRNKFRYYIGPWRTTHSYDINARSLLLRIIDSIKDGSLIRKFKGSTQTNIDNILIYKLKIFLYKSTNYYQKPAFVIGTGSLGRSQLTNMFSVKNFVSIRSNDVDWDKLPNLIDQKYCIYVDESICYSPNTGLNEETSTNSTSNDIKKFNQNMCRVFDEVEKKLGVKVIIACSGKFNYDDDSFYGSREIIYGKTNQLIQHAELVLGHASSGIYQSIISKKPVIILNDPSFIESKSLQIEPFADWLNVKVLVTTDFSSKDIDNLDNNEKHFKKIEIQYFADNEVVDDYQAFIIKYFVDVIKQEDA
ncbi:hypothetical protein N9R34_02555 [Candidatus Thioglobus sp.]|nr:hypothetical protein [Candidatus Thioglobus sp.]